jgi:signal transduction histidine kinase
VLSRSSELIARHFGASRVLYGDYDTEQQQVSFHSNHTDRSVAELSGTLPVSLFGAENFSSLEQGLTWVNHEIQTDPRTSSPQILRKFKKCGIASAVIVSLNRNKAIVPCLFVTANVPRQWDDDDVSLIEDAAGRIWNAVERIRAEEALKQADRRKDEFLAMLAHELRNPLAPIGAAANLLQCANLNETRLLQTSQVIERQVRHMTSLVDDLLDVSRVTRGLVKLDTIPLDIRQIVTDAVEQVTPLVLSKQHHLSMKLSPGSARVMGDKKRLVQIIANLLNNAAKYTPDGGKIVLSVEVDAKRVQLHVRDNGVGMTPELVAHVFELFAQAERSSDRSAGGLGLGLALVKSLVELHGGTVACHSGGPGKGSRFTICLPRLPEDQGTPEVPRPQSALPPTVGGLRILVVDDNEDAAAVLSILLEMEGHHVMVEHSSHKALERARINPPDVCLLDIGLPEINGNELARLLLAQSGGQAMTLVAVTGYGQESDRELTRAAGFAHHLVKPVDIPKLFSILAEINKS